MRDYLLTYKQHCNSPKYGKDRYWWQLETLSFKAETDKIAIETTVHFLSRKTCRVEEETYYREFISLVCIRAIPRFKVIKVILEQVGKK